MRSILEFFARRHMLATLFTLMVVLLGLSSVVTLKRDIFPEVDMGMVYIQTVYPGAAPEDVELNVTNKIEDQLADITGIRLMTSSSMEDFSQIILTLEPDLEDTAEVKRDIRDAVARVSDLPDEVRERPQVIEIDTSIIDICEVGVTGDIPYAELRKIAKQFQRKLEAVPGVSHVERYGYRAREVKVEVDPAAIERYQIPMREIIAAVASRNIRQTGGTFESFTSEKNVVTLAQFEEPLEVGDVIVRSGFEGPQIRVRDLAIVREDFEEEELISRMEGRKAISFEVFKTDTADIIRTVDAVRELVRTESGRGLFAGEVEVETAEPRSGLAGFLGRLTGAPQTGATIYRYGPVRIIISDDLSKFVRDRFQIVLTNGLLGLALVLVVLSIFLNMRTAFWVAMGIPVSFLGVIFLLPLFDQFLDSLTLISMVLLIGIIVDDGIIISENIYRRHEMGDPPALAAVNGAHEVFAPVITTVLTTFLAFAPMFFMSGLMGRFVFVIPLAVSLALLVSLLEAVFALPAHLARGMERSRKNIERGFVRDGFQKLKEWYAVFCERVLRFRYPLVALFAIVLVGALWYAATSMQFIMFPSKGAEQFWIGIETPIGTPLEATNRRVAELERIVQDLPVEELDTFVTRVGTNLELGAGEHYAYIAVTLTPFSERQRTADQIVEHLRQEMTRLAPDVRTTFQIDSGGPPVGRPVTLRVTGDDDEDRRALAAAVVEAMEEIPGIRDIESDDKPGKEQIAIRFDYPRLARLGLTVADVAQAVRIAYDGEVVTSLRQGDEDIDFRVQIAESARRDLDYLHNLTVPNDRNRLIRLREVATLETTVGPDAYRHVDGLRTITVDADLDQSVTTSLLATETILDRIDMTEWQGLQLEVGGEAEESAESMVNLALTFIIAVLAIYFLLVLLFNNFTQPLLVLASVPFGITGVIIAFALHGEFLGFMALMGVVGLGGVVVNDSLVLVNHLNNLRRQMPEEPILKIVGEGTSHRLRAIVLTTLTTVAGLLPLAYGIGGTDIFMAPMALALGWGLVFATPLTLVLIPCLYVIGADIRGLLGKGAPPPTPGS